jgi:hypothetical protein
MEAGAGGWKRRFAMSKKMTRVVVALLVLVTFTAGAAPAAPWSLAGESEASPFAALWERIVSWFQSSTVEEGCSMDPNGRCGGGATTDEGSQMDPNG